MHKTAIIFLLIILSWGCNEQEDFPYPPATYRTPICFPDDWQKSLVDNNGSLNYDFGPGPYAKPKTEVAVTIKEAELAVKSQKLHNARVPLVITEFSGNGIKMQQQTFALTEKWYPAIPKDPNEDFAVKRYLGLNGAIGWAQPTQICDPAFRNVTWGTGRPIRYKIPVIRGSAKQVALGFCDSYREKGKITRVMTLNIEGATERDIDLLVSGEQNQPQAFAFNARDVNRDGQLDIEVRASTKTQDPNVLLNVIWVFPRDFAISIPEIISGKLTSASEKYVDCGFEPQLQNMPQRRDAIIAKVSGEGLTPLLRIKTNRELVFQADTGVLLFRQQPFVMTQPKALKCEKTSNGWLLEFSKNIPQIEVVVLHGRLENEAIKFPDLAAARKAVINFWENQIKLPWDNISVPDTRIQALFESSVRVLHQIREYVDGYPQFQPGPSVYRGFWASDGIWDADAAMLTDDFESAQFTVDRFVDHQTENGRIEIMSPSLLHRETAHFMWLLHRYATLAQDTVWLQKHWPYMENAFSHYQDLRKTASADPKQPYFALTPPGLTDGGIGGVNAEYGGVYWGLIGMKAAIESAHLIGKQRQAKAWQMEYDDFLAAFHRAAERDMVTDENGNTYLPMKMNMEGDVPFPQRGQGQLLHTIFPGDIFGLEDPFVRGMLEIFERNIEEGLVLDTGWLKGGVWPFFATHRGLAELWVGRVDRAKRALDALADHASPTLLWVEEQMPQDKGTKIAGDTPQTNANAQLIRLLRHLLVLERGDSLHILHGLPERWLKPGSVLWLNGVPTTFGKLQLSMNLSEDGNEAIVEIDPIESWKEENVATVSLHAFIKKGFHWREEVSSSVWSGALTEKVRLELTK